MEVDDRLEQLLQFGFEEEDARRALSELPNGSIEDIANYICNIQDSYTQVDDTDDGLDNISLHVNTDNPALQLNPFLHQVQEEEEEEYKLVLIVRTDLKMSPGKVASQCVHAALGAFRRIGYIDFNLCQKWQMQGEKTVCLKCNDVAEVNRLCAEAERAGLVVYAVHDAGRTEVEPGTRTVVAIGPNTKTKVDAVTGKLRLY